MKKLRTSFEGVTYRQKLFAFAICVPIALMASKCDPSPSITCPPLKKYSEEEQLRMLSQYEKVEQLGIAPDLIGFVNDHIDLRSAIKKCIARRDHYKK